MHYKTATFLGLLSHSTCPLQILFELKSLKSSSSWSSCDQGFSSWVAFCALISFGDVKYWGKNSEGQLGEGTAVNRSLPVAIAPGFTYAQITTGDHTCGITDNGALKCWGRSDSSQLGQGQNYTKASAGRAHICAITNSGALYCCGYDLFGQLGIAGRNYSFPWPVIK